MKKFKVEVNLRSEYEVSIDDEALGGEEFLEHFKKYFSDCEDWEEHAVDIATYKAKGFTFIEGYGSPLVNGERQPFTDESMMNSHINLIPTYENEAEIDCYPLN
jgi:hypothetical protein